MDVYNANRTKPASKCPLKRSVNSVSEKKLHISQSILQHLQLIPLYKRFQYYLLFIFHIKNSNKLTLFAYTLSFLMFEEFIILKCIMFALIVLTILVYVGLYYLPKKNFLWHKKVYEALGYNVKVYDFKFLGTSFFDEMDQMEKQHQDPQYSLRKGQISKYDIILSNIITKTSVSLINPNLIKQLFTQSNLDKFPKPQIFVNNLRRILGEGIFLSQGHVWKRKRQVFNRIFNHQFIVANIPTMIKLLNEIFDQHQQAYFKQHPKSRDQLQITITPIFSDLYAKIIIKNFFGKQFKDQEIEGYSMSIFLRNILLDLARQSLEPTGALLGSWIYDLGLTKRDRDLNRRIKIAKNLVKDFIEQRLQEIKKKGNTQEETSDLVQAIYKHKIQQKDNKQENYDYHELIDEFFTFYQAGSDTNQRFTTTMIYYIILNPNVQLKLREEVDKMIKKDEDITWENLKKLEYIDWIQNQTTRLYGFTGILPRISTENQLISNIPLKKGDFVQYQALPNHVNPQFFKNPQEFRPQRWEKQCKKLHPYILIGFSFGPRSCIGKNLALLQSKIALIKFIRRYKTMKLPCKEIKFRDKLLISPVQMKVFLKKSEQRMT